MEVTPLPLPRPVEEKKRLLHHELPTSRKLTIAAFVILSQLIQMIPYGAGIVGAPGISKELNVPLSKGVWIAASYPLTQGAFIIAGGRIGALYGHKHTIVVAGLWWILWSLISGFMRNIVGLSITRGLTGIGGAFMVPNAVALLGITFPPGKMRNITVGLFGAAGPIGAAGGTVFGGIFIQLTHWKWLFFFL
jgi:MFS family permease